MKRTIKQLLAVLLSVAGLLLVVASTQSEAVAQAADDPADVAAGQAIYEQGCNGCHGDSGEGVSGLGRPLTGIADQADRATHIASITNGKGNMPAFGDRLSEEQIGQVTSYLRLTFVAEEAAASTGETELALTGVESTGLAVIGMTMLIGGLQLVAFSRRRQ